MVATASGCVMYGSPLLRIWPSCERSAVSYARWSVAMSADGWSSRWTAASGSSTGLTTPERWAVIRRAMRARTRRVAEGARVALTGGAGESPADSRTASSLPFPSVSGAPSGAGSVASGVPVASTCWLTRRPSLRTTEEDPRPSRPESIQDIPASARCPVGRAPIGRSVVHDRYAWVTVPHSGP